jgi:YcxB-like protein
MMPIIVDYQLRRSEIWTLYWWMWRRGLWRSHLIAFATVGIAASLLIYRAAPPNALGWTIVLAAASFLPALWIVYPQLRFKPQQRTLVIDASGIRTKIGGRSGSVEWRQIGVVAQVRGAVILQRRRGNAFVVPARAFASPEAFQDFTHEAQQARAAA